MAKSRFLSFIHVWASPEALVRMCSWGLGSVHLLWSTASMQSHGSQGETLRGSWGAGDLCVCGHIEGPEDISL